MPPIPAREAFRRRLPSWTVAAFTFLLAGACQPTPQPETDVTAKRPVDEVLMAHTPELMKLSGVVGTAQGEEGGKPVILVLVKRATPRLRERLPRSLEGYRVVVRVTGAIQALDRP